MKALKAIAIIMGILIVTVFAFVVVTIVGRVGGDNPARQLGTVTLEAVTDCSLANAWSDEGLLYLRLEGVETSNCAAILLIDPKSGKEVGRIRLGQNSVAVE